MSFDAGKIIKAVAADKRKLSLMVALLAVAMLLWGRLMLKGVPRTANAKPKAVATGSNPRDVKGPGARPVVQVELPAGLTRDLFALDDTSYPTVPPTADALPRSDKSATPPADEHTAADLVREQARKLALGSLVQGNRPCAVINGKLVAVGGTIDGFKLVRVEARSVILEKDGLLLRLRLGLNL